MDNFEGTMADKEARAARAETNINSATTWLIMGPIIICLSLR